MAKWGFINPQRLLVSRYWRSPMKKIQQTSLDLRKRGPDGCCQDIFLGMKYYPVMWVSFYKPGLMRIPVRQPGFNKHFTSIGFVEVVIFDLIWPGYSSPWTTTIWENMFFIFFQSSKTWCKNLSRRGYNLVFQHFSAIGDPISVKVRKGGVQQNPAKNWDYCIIQAFWMDPWKNTAIALVRLRNYPQ